jgi:hypothetical protein
LFPTEKPILDGLRPGTPRTCYNCGHDLLSRFWLGRPIIAKLCAALSITC